MEHNGSRSRSVGAHVRVAGRRGRQVAVAAATAAVAVAAAVAAPAAAAAERGGSISGYFPEGFAALW